MAQNDTTVYIPKTLLVDLRPFGFGIREVTVLAGYGCQPGPDSVGTDEIQNGGVHHEDLGEDVEAGNSDIDNIFDQNGGDAGQGGGGDTDDEEEGPEGEVPGEMTVEEGD